MEEVMEFQNIEDYITKKFSESDTLDLADIKKDMLDDEFFNSKEEYQNSREIILEKINNFVACEQFLIKKVINGDLLPIESLNHVGKLSIYIKGEKQRIAIPIIPFHAFIRTQ